ncbi:MAG: phospho-N-acetylmuramoyl-pentapeptide-transferase [Oscillospiraceae bacterium]
MIFYLIQNSNVSTALLWLIVVAVSFLLSFLSLKCFKKLLPKDQGRQYAVNGALSEGKPRGAGLLFITSFVISCTLFVPMSLQEVINIVLIYVAMLMGFFDDSAEKPWGELKKGLIDGVISIGVAVNFVVHNSTDIFFFGHLIHIPVVLYVILGAVLVWASINVTNCSDGVDGLCGSLSISTLVLFGLLLVNTNMFVPDVIMIMTLFAYLWFNASPSRLLMGDAGSRAIGVFIAMMAMYSNHPLLFIPFAIVLILDGGLGLVKLTIRRVTKKMNFMEKIRTPLHDHARKKNNWSDTQVVTRFVIIQTIIGLAAYLLASI